MRLVDAPVVSNEPAGAGLYMLRIDAPELAREARPGQFLHVRCRTADSYDPLLRRPISLFRAEGDVLLLYYDVVGRGTDFLSRARPGDVVNVLGPLGRPFRVSTSSRNLLMVGGGIGLAPLAMLAEQALAGDLAVTLLGGFRNAERVLDPRFLPPQVEYVVATDDGSAGHHGFVTELVPTYLAWADEVFACGPTPMLQSLARACGDTTKPIQVSLEERMGCAMGVCLSCVLRTRQGLKRVCRDGPVFDLRDLKELQWRKA